MRRRGIYLLPNLFTTAALFAGFYAIVQAMNARFEQAAVAIFIAMVLDGLDGRVARLTHTQSAFGAEYDSLSDMVSFGAAPALVMYEWALKEHRHRSAGSPPSSIAPARRCGWRASTPILRWSTSAFSRDCPARRRPRWWPGLIWVVDDFKIEAVSTMRWIACVHHAVRRAHHGEQCSVLQLQGYQFRRSVPFWAIPVALALAMIADFHPSADGAVPAVRRLCRCRAMWFGRGSGGAEELCKTRDQGERRPALVAPAPRSAVAK